MTAELTPADMAALHAACFTTPRPWSQAEISALLASDLVFALTAPQGFLLGRVVAGEAELLTIVVAPAARRQGTGAGLLTAFLAEAIKRGGESVFLEVAENNAAARALYAAFGFAQAGRRRAYYHSPDHPPQDALVLVRSLT